MNDTEQLFKKRPDHGVHLCKDIVKSTFDLSWGGLMIDTLSRTFDCSR